MLVRTYDEFNKDNILLLAGAVAFFAVLALIPAITAAVSLYALVSDPASVQSQFRELRGLMPDTSFDLLKEQVERIVSQQTSNGLWFVVGVLIALWSAMSGMKGLIDTLNVVYEVKDERSLLRYNLIALWMTLGALVWLGIAIVGLIAIPIILSYFPFGSFGAQVANWARWPALLIVLMYRACRALPIRAAPAASALGMGQPRQSVRGSRLADRLGGAVLVSELFRKLQRDLRLARRGRGANDMAVGDRRDRIARGRTEF